ncbi:hypothetical protein IDH44_01410 [Paenibacillus sp. IB182496]|uniref:Uncharacterized protein n=1 Tax=Paenibacillus sabuli TaxID=2772509 RepID=A0A927BQI1_9BACL|nr:hypothetical protein [Paenibacillus sabuli]MBD2843835.1 hypothetical protein [Paenibacillus sabuli]
MTIFESPPAAQPDTVRLGRWLHAWICADGAIHGFNNHAVWGGNPYRWTDFHSGHSTWSSPLLSALALLLERRPDDYGAETLRRLVRFQIASFQDNGQYRYIGFESGEVSRNALIHNMVPDLALATAVRHAAPLLGEALCEQVRQAVVRNLEACAARWGGGRPGPSGTCNQEYARIWAKLALREACGERRWDEELTEDLDRMIRDYHVAGVPDASCEGTLRYAGDARTLEPAEYYGLMIVPLVLAAAAFGESRYLDRAAALCRHIVRSAWVDGAGQTRFHRLWHRRAGRWEKLDQPMLIAGMGLTLYGIRACAAALGGDAELEGFLEDCERTYAHYQTAGGYFVSATGWGNEADIAPSTAWHAHDLLYLASRTADPAPFWRGWADGLPPRSVLLGNDCLWIEDGLHWSIGDYFWQDIYNLLGKRDEARFHRKIPAWTGYARIHPPRVELPDPPVFVKTERGIYLKSDHDTPYAVRSATDVPYLGVYEQQ